MGLWVTFEKWWKFPSVMWTHNALQITQNSEESPNLYLDQPITEPGKPANNLISQRFFPQRRAAWTPQISLWVVPLLVVYQYITNIAAIQNMAVLQQIWLYKIIGGTLSMFQNTTMWVNGAWIKRYCVLCSKTYNTMHSCHNFPASSRQTARSACICEMSLLEAMSHIPLTVLQPPS